MKNVQEGGRFGTAKNLPWSFLAIFYIYGLIGICIAILNKEIEVEQ